MIAQNISYFSASSVPATSTTSTIFGGAKSPDTQSNQQQSSNMFGAKVADSTSLSFASFGLSSTPASTVASPPASAGNIFANAAVGAKPAQNIFGEAVSSATSATSTASIFGGTTPASPANAGFASSPFGNANTSSTNIFGGSNVATSSMLNDDPFTHQKS